MKVLAPIDGSECSFRALEYATDFVRRYDGTLHVVHITTADGGSTDEILSRAEEYLESEGIAADPELVTTVRSIDPRYGTRIGKDILRLVDERGYEHVIMGHHGAGAVGRLVLGSAAQTVVQAVKTPVTVIP